jgi:FkbM family methyltransferase
MDVVTKWNSRLFRTWPNSANWLVLAQRIYMKASAVVKKDRVATTIFGSTMDCKIDDNIDRRIYFFGVWEPNLTHFIKHVIKQGDIVVDVGANIGYFTLLMSRLVQKDGSVVAIEASTTTFNKLAKNIERNHCANVISRHVAVSDHKGEIKLFYSKYGDKDTGKISTVEQPGAAVVTSVPCDTLMSILASAVPIDRVSFLKIDIEGAEAPVLSEIIENKDRFSPRLVVVSEIADRNIHFIDAFANNGFKCFYLENDYAFDASMGLTGREEGEFGRLQPLENKGERPPTADLVFVYERSVKS